MIFRKTVQFFSLAGMTQRGQVDVLEYFKNGRHKLIVATTVAEEGLDISKCNVVIRYEHVTNETARIQTKGTWEKPVNGSQNETDNSTSKFHFLVLFKKYK